MKICFVGLGSIARRHIKNIKKLYPDAEIDILRHDRSSSSDEEYGNMLYSYDELADSYDSIFITNPTTMHMDALRRLADRSDVFFIEKPLRPMGEQVKDLDSLPADKIY